jgi:hypothetical protein
MAICIDDRLSLYTDSTAYDAYTAIFTPNTYHTCVNANTTIRLPRCSASHSYGSDSHIRPITTNITTALVKGSGRLSQQFHSQANANMCARPFHRSELICHC